MAAATSNQIVAYITDTLVRGVTKQDAYRMHVNASIVDVYNAIARMEKTEQFAQIYDMITSDDNYRVAAVVKEAKLDYAMMVRKNMQVMGEVYQRVEGEDASLKDKSAAIRLGNETIQAMAVVGGGAQHQTPSAPGQLDKGSAVLGGS